MEKKVLFFILSFLVGRAWAAPTPVPVSDILGNPLEPMRKYYATIVHQQQQPHGGVATLAYPNNSAPDPTYIYETSLTGSMGETVVFELTTPPEGAVHKDVIYENTRIKIIFISKNNISYTWHAYAIHEAIYVMAGTIEARDPPEARFKIVSHDSLDDDDDDGRKAYTIVYSSDDSRFGDDFSIFTVAIDRINYLQLIHLNATLRLHGTLFQFVPLY